MMRVVSYLSASPIHGIGCFTKQPIAKGQLVWEFDQSFDRDFTPEEVAKLPNATQAFFGSHAWASPNKTILICIDNGSYFNHHDQANTRMTPDGLQCIATRDIAAGEELTTDYAELPDIAEACREARCLAHNMRSTVFFQKARSYPHQSVNLPS